LNTARAIRFQAGFPKHFWNECVLFATQIINLLPMENLSWKSPFEVLYGKPPKLDDLRTIGCLCFANNVGESDKFAPRATRIVLLGYTFGLKGYKKIGSPTWMAAKWIPLKWYLGFVQSITFDWIMENQTNISAKNFLPFIESLEIPK